MSAPYDPVALDSAPTSVEQSPVKARKTENYILLPNEWKIMIIVYFGVLIGAIIFNLSVVFPTNLSSKISGFLSDNIPSDYPAIQDLFLFAILFSLSVKFNIFQLIFDILNQFLLCNVSFVDSVDYMDIYSDPPQN